MKSKLIFSAFCTLIVGAAFAQFQHSFGTPSVEYGMSLTDLVDDEGKYLISGITTEQFFGGNDATLTKTDFFGNQQWSAIYGGEALDYFTSVRQSDFAFASQISYVAAGQTNSSGFGGGDAWLVGTDANGNPIFSGIYGRQGNDVFHDVKNYRGQSLDLSGYVAVGSTTSYPTFPGKSVYVVKTDLFGNQVAATVIGYEGDQEGFWIEQTRDGGFILVGYTTNYFCSSSPTKESSQDIFVVRLRPDLTMAWNQTFGYPGYAGPLASTNIGRAVKESENGNFIITGYTNAFGLENTYDAFLLTLNASGGFQTFSTYGTPCDNEFGYSLELGNFSSTGNSTVTVLGGHHSVTGKDYNAMMFQTDISLNLLWAQEYGLDGQELGLELTADFDQHYAFTGYTSSLGVGSFDKYLVETDLNGKSGTICENEIGLERVRHEPCVVKFGQQIFVQGYEFIDLKYDRIFFEEGRCTNAGARLGEASEIPKTGFNVEVLPNPSEDNILVKLNDGSQVTAIKVFDLQGKVYPVKSKEKSIGQLSLDIAKLKGGVYILELVAENGQMTRKKFIKK